MFRAKKIALAVAMAAATMSMAQATEVEVFGRFDTGMMYTINSGDSKDNFQMTSGHTTGSRWGIKATEKLNADWTVRAHLESGIESDTGELSSSGRIFGRQMTISLKNPSFGEIAFGRSGKPLSGSDQFTRIRPFTPFGVTYGDAGLLFYGKGGRIDNAVFYQSPKFAGFTVLAAASTQTSNQEEAEWTDNTRFWGGSIDWKGGNVGLMIGAEQTVAKASDKAKGEENPTTLYLGAYYDFGVAKIMAGYQRGWNLDRIGCLRDVEIGSIDTDKTTKNFDANFYLLGATIPAGKGLVRLSAIYMDGENSQELGPNLGKDASYWSLGAGYTYPFSKRTSIYGVVAHLHGEDAIDKDNNASNGDGDLTRYQIAVGLVHKF
jgi:GBP family porin